MCICVCLLPIFTLDWICSFTCSYQQLHVHIDSLLSPIFPITVSQIANSPWWALPSILFFLAVFSHTFTFKHILSTHIPTVQSTLNSKIRGNKTLTHRKPFSFLWISPPRTVLFYEMSAITSRQCQGEGNMSAPPCWAFSRSGSLQLMTRVWRVLP